jgi:DNA polymerase III subunit delta
MAKTHTQIISDFKKGEAQSLYVLQGEEPYYIDKICDGAEAYILQPHEKDFNFSIFYGKDADWSTVLSTCRKYPMFAEKQLVIIKEAQAMKDLPKLDLYVQQLLPSTVLIIAHKYKKMDARTAFSKSCTKYGTVFTSDLVKDYQLPDWIKNYGTEKKLNISIDVANVLANSLGSDLQKIVKEIDKVLLNAPDATTLTTDMVEKYIGISKDYNVFELPKMLMVRNTPAALKMVHYFLANPKDAPMVLLLGSLYNAFSKLHAYHYVSSMPDAVAAQKLGINQWGIKDFKLGLPYYNVAQTEKVLDIIYKSSQKTLGFNSSVSYGGLLKETVSLILNA